MIELLNLENKLKVINIRCKPIQTLYLYWDPTNLIIYKNMESYKNYLG